MHQPPTAWDLWQQAQAFPSSSSVQPLTHPPDSSSDPNANLNPPFVVLKSGCRAIDELLGGGFRSGILTEVAGEASSGKTQLAMQLLLQSQLPVALGGLDATSVYISTEGIGHMKRLSELAHAFATKYVALLPNASARVGGGRELDTKRLLTQRLLDGVFIETVYEVDELLEMMQSRLPTLLQEHKVRLVVLDSIGALFRTEATTSVKEASDRSRLLFHVANCMRILSTQFQVVFVITNQVTSALSSQVRMNLPLAASINNALQWEEEEAAAAEDPQAGGDGCSRVRPALGLSWSNCINQRLMISRQSTTRSINNANHRNNQRWLRVVFSPSLARRRAAFQITASGVTSVA